MNFIIDLEDFATYEVEADSEEEATLQALQWWYERMPDIRVQIQE